MSPRPEPADAELVLAVVARDDRGAFALLVRRHQSMVRSVLRRLARGDHALADDLAQETFLSAWRNLASFRHDARFSTWLYRIAVRTALDLLRQRKRARQWERLLGWLGLREPTPGATKDPLVELEARERARLLMEAIDALPEQQRVAYTLVAFERLKGEEVAEVMETTASAVESLLFRARSNLRQRLREYYLAAGAEPRGAGGEEKAHG